MAAGGRQFEGCWGPNKKQAEQQAALAALLHLDLAVTDVDGDIRLSDACWNDDPIDNPVAEEAAAKESAEGLAGGAVSGSTGIEDVQQPEDADDLPVDVETLIE